MSQSSDSNSIGPYSGLERVFHSHFRDNSSSNSSSESDDHPDLPLYEDDYVNTVDKSSFSSTESESSLSEMGENHRRNMMELNRPVTDDSEGAIVIPGFDAVNFELKSSLITLVQNNAQFSGIPSDDPYAHLKKFRKACGTYKVNQVPKDVIRLMLFPYSLTGRALSWYESLPSNSIHSWGDMENKFLVKYCPPSRTTKQVTEILLFKQRPEESLYDAWERYKESIMRCPNHGIPLNQQFKVFYEGVHPMYHSLIDSACNGTVYKKTPEEAFELLDDLVMSQTSAPNDFFGGGASAIAELTKQIAQLTAQSQNRYPPPAPVHAIHPGCEHCGGSHAGYECQAIYHYEPQEEACLSSGDYNGGGMARYTHPNPNYPGYSQNQRPPGFTNPRPRLLQRPQFNSQGGYNQASSSNQGYNQPSSSSQGYNQGFQQGASFSSQNQGYYPRSQPYQHPNSQNPNQGYRSQDRAYFDEMMAKNQAEQAAVNRSHQATMQNIEKQLGQIATTLGERNPGGLPGDTVPNPKAEAKMIVTRSGKELDGPTLPDDLLPPSNSPPSNSTVAEQEEPEISMDEMQTPSP